MLGTTREATLGMSSCPQVAASLDEMGRRGQSVDPLVRCFPPPQNVTIG